MPMQDWKLVFDGIFHAFHHEWISELGRALNAGVLPDDLYAMPEQVAGGFGPDVIALQTGGEPAGAVATAPRALQPRPAGKITAQTEAEFYRRKKSAIVVRHVSGDRVVAMIEIVSPGNKSSKNGIRSFVNKACELLEAGVHLLIVDPFPPGPRDPNGIHALIWGELTDDAFQLPADRPLTLVSYECDFVTRAYVQNTAVGTPLPDMELFVEPNGCVVVPLEATYAAAFAAQPRRWRDVLQPPGA